MLKDFCIYLNLYADFISNLDCELFFDLTKYPITAAIATGTTQLNPKLANGKLFITGTLTPKSLIIFNILINSAAYVANLNTLSFLILSPNSVNTTKTIVGGYTNVNIGAENCIIVLTPKLDTTKLNKHTTVTTTSYFNLLFLSLAKY